MGTGQTEEEKGKSDTVSVFQAAPSLEVRQNLLKNKGPGSQTMRIPLGGDE